MSKGAQIALGALIIAAVLVWYAYGQLEGEGSYRYYQTLDEFRADRAQIGDEPFRVHGYVALESIERDVPNKNVRFSVQNEPPHAGGSAEAAMPVVFESLETPDLFKDGAEVVVEGRFVTQGNHSVLVADNVMAKCPSKFQAQEETAESSGPL